MNLSLSVHSLWVYPSGVFFRFFQCVIQLSKNYEIVSSQVSYVSRLMIGLFSLEIQKVEPKDGKGHNLMLFTFIELYFVIFFRASFGISLDCIHVLLTLKDYKTWAWSQTSNRNWTCGLLCRILWFFKKGFLNLKVSFFADFWIYKFVGSEFFVFLLGIIVVSSF